MTAAALMSGKFDRGRRRRNARPKAWDDSSYVASSDAADEYRETVRGRSSVDQHVERVIDGSSSLRLESVGRSKVVIADTAPPAHAVVVEERESFFPSEAEIAVMPRRLVAWKLVRGLALLSIIGLLLALLAAVLVGIWVTTEADWFIMATSVAASSGLAATAIVAVVSVVWRLRSRI